MLPPFYDEETEAWSDEIISRDDTARTGKTRIQTQAMWLQAHDLNSIIHASDCPYQNHPLKTPPSSHYYTKTTILRKLHGDQRVQQNFLEMWPVWLSN